MTQNSHQMTVADRIINRKPSGAGCCKEWLARGTTLPLFPNSAKEVAITYIELEWTSQEAFYNGLREEYKQMVVHMLVEAVQKIEAMLERQCQQRINASCYPLLKLMYSKNKDQDHKDGKLHSQSESVIKAKATQMKPDSELEDIHTKANLEAKQLEDENALWKDSYYCCAIHQVKQ